MKHFVITIGCEYGSGGPDIGKMIADSWESSIMTAIWWTK